MLRIKVYRFLPVPNDDAYTNIDQFPTIKAALMEGVDLDTPIRAGRSSISFSVPLIKQKSAYIRMNDYPNIRKINCVYSWVPEDLPTQNDAEYVVILRRVEFMVRSIDGADDRYLQRTYPQFFIKHRLFDWYEVFWQVALMPLCDDVKRILVYCLIEV